MELEIEQHWPEIRSLVHRAFRSSSHFAFSTVNPDGTPHVTPIGSLVLRRGEPKAIYFEAFTMKMPANVDAGSRVCILAVDSGKWFWFKSLLGGRFARPPAVRLVGTVGAARQPTDEERQLWYRRVDSVKWSKGYKLLWTNFRCVRDIEFDAFEPVNLGLMTKGHWK